MPLDDRIPARLAAIRRDFSLYKLLNPAPRQRVDEEKHRFFEARNEGRAYNPRFEYAPIDRARLDAERQWLDAADVGDGPLGRLLAEERDVLRAHLAMAAARDNAAEFTRLGIEAFSRPAESDVAAAREALRTTPAKSREAAIPAEELAAAARKHLDSLGLIDWRVRINPDILSVLKVETAARLVEIKASVVFDELDVISLLRHEIEGHAVRAQNGFNLGYEFLGTGVGNEVELDEGIAVWLEERHGGFVGRRALELIARVLAADLALRADFATTYDTLEGMAPSIGRDLLFQMVARVKRPLRDTAQPGGWTKDALYYTGFLKVRSLLADASDRKSAWGRLMVARVGWRGIDPACELARSKGRQV